MHNNYILTFICVFHLLNYLVRIYFPPDKFLLPELQCLLQSQTDAFQEEPVLHTASVPEMVVITQGSMQLPHAKWERFHRKLSREKMV